MASAIPLDNGSSGVSVSAPGPSSMSEALSFRTEPRGSPSTTTLIGGSLDLNSSVLQAYNTFVTIREASATERKTFLGDTFLPA